MSDIKQTVEKDVDYNKVKAAILKIGDMGKAMAASGLTEKTITLLLHDATGVGKPDIRRILQALPNLPRWYLTAAAISAPTAVKK